MYSIAIGFHFRYFKGEFGRKLAFRWLEDREGIAARWLTVG